MDFAFPMVIGIKNIKMPKRFRRKNLAMVSSFLGVFNVLVVLSNILVPPNIYLVFNDT
jgi:hypothetical protein